MQVEVTFKRPRHRTTYFFESGIQLVWSGPPIPLPIPLSHTFYGKAQLGAFQSPKDGGTQHWLVLSYQHTPTDLSHPTQDMPGTFLDTSAPFQCSVWGGEDGRGGRGTYRCEISQRSMTKLLAHWYLHHQGKRWCPFVLRERSAYAHLLHTAAHTQLWIAL